MTSTTTARPQNHPYADGTVLVQEVQHQFPDALPHASRPMPRLVEPDSVAMESNPRRDLSTPVSPVNHPRITMVPVYRNNQHEHAVRDMLLRPSVSQRLYRAADTLPDGFGLTVFDAWRPRCLQRELYEQAYSNTELPPGFVTEPDPTQTAPHGTGATVDLTLSWRGAPLALGTRFDAFTPDAAAAAFETLPGAVQDLRRLLYWTLRSQDFVVHAQEWWHFEVATPRWAGITGYRGSVWGSAPIHHCGTCILTRLKTR